MLDFDHRERSEKKFTIGAMISRKSISIGALVAEIEKCDVRCANCHRRKTHRELIAARELLSQQHDGRATDS